MICMLTKLVLLNANTFISEPLIVIKTDTIYFIIVFVSAHYTTNDQRFNGYFLIKGSFIKAFFIYLSLSFIWLFKLFTFLGAPFSAPTGFCWS